MREGNAGFDARLSLATFEYRKRHGIFRAKNRMAQTQIKHQTRVFLAPKFERQI